MIYGAILAGGIGKRIERHSIPKQFINIGGVPIIVMTLRAFLSNPQFDKIYVAVHQDWMVYAERLFKDGFSADELLRVRIISGGAERLDSFTNIMDDIINRKGLNDDDILICHDAVRPFVRQQMIDDCIKATQEKGLSLTVVPVNDTIHTTHDDETMIDGTLERSHLYNGQTPSGFNIRLLHDTLASCTAEEKAKSTGTTQLMLAKGHQIKMVQGHTSNFKITTDNDLDVADRIVRSQRSERSVSLLDCTLRDGGIVLNFDFGLERMLSIKHCLEEAGVDFIECGYIDEKKGSPVGRTCFDNERSIRDTLLAEGKKKGITYVAMIDYGTFDLNKLEPRDERGIDGIRYAFHKENVHEALIAAQTILDKGFDLYLQPMVSLRYSDEEFRDMIIYCNTHLSAANAFYIVDSFGQMDNMTLVRHLELADLYVSDRMKIGFHAHNNRQMAYSNALAWVGYPSRHDLMIDSSIMGMGKGAGNLCTELIMPVLTAEGGNYSTVGIYNQINDYVSSELKAHPWGYSLDYYLSSLYGCTPSYVKIFTKDERVTTDDLVNLLRDMPSEKKAACDRAFAATYLQSYLSKK
ncbi:MAG: D-ribitol-5-phosphate cytidylyltransferase [Prevotella sp.]|nr:D-ribitol-5-phosphate cytidylyltransferase [Prevotella sp.]